jgi:hypothetical protein
MLKLLEFTCENLKIWTEGKIKKYHSDKIVKFGNKTAKHSSHIS